jgi:hypothetical protein
MTRRQARIIRAAFFTVLILVIAGAAHHRFAGGSANLPTPSSATPDAAAAMRSITGTTRPSKPWVVDFASYTAEHPGQWIVGRCAGPCLSQAEAQLLARTDAARSICNLALIRRGFTRDDQHWIVQRLDEDLQAGEFVSDDLPEHFTRPYGTIWTDSVLLNVSPEKLDRVLNQYRGELQARSIRSKRIEVIAGGVAVTTWLAYLLCNAITRGYFSLRLQMIAGTITAIALLVLLGGP